ncbi:hypothetical protein LCGC14_0921070 [marine sediment metagenome]|uniref:Uncharacterized protein n=1 Tax=marine sediment metagenome TaxID=412755 RepID=A0A0F9RXI3_9ZZZZ
MKPKPSMTLEEEAAWLEEMRCAQPADRKGIALWRRWGEMERRDRVTALEREASKDAPCAPGGKP